jgi:homocysteine S-methyltransferase
VVNCVHPTVFGQALDHELGACSTVSERVIGLQANTSAKPPEELDNLSGLESQDPEPFAEEMMRLYDRYGTKVLGGCCGTDDRHIACIARRAIGRVARATPGQEEQ